MWDTVESFMQVKKMEQILFPLSRSFNHAWSNEQRAEMVEHWGIKPHWNWEIGRLSFRCLKTRERICCSKSLLVMDRMEMGQ